MKSAVVLVFVLATSSFSAANTPPLTKIEIFTDHDYPVTAQGHLNIDIYHLDTPGRIERSLSVGLPADLITAKRIATQRVREIGAAQAGDLKQVFQGLLKARKYQLDRLPAIVFDGGRVVVYGVTDLDAAHFHYRQWHRAQGRE